MPMEVGFSPLLFLVLATMAIGDEFESCTSGSSCAAWNALLHGEVQVSIQEKVKGANSDYYRIEVTPGNGASSWTKLRRYSAFSSLHEILGEHHPSLPPFPPKLYLNTILENFWPQKLEDRRAQLELWLQKVVAHDNSKSLWSDALFDFLDPKSASAILKSGISMPSDANRMCNGDIHYFGIDVSEGADKVVRTWRRYSDFLVLNATLEKLGAKEGDFEVDLPPKVFWNKLQVFKIWESQIEERRHTLEAWLRQVKLHANSASGGIWVDEVTKFLDPEANKEQLAWDCMKEDFVNAPREEMAAWFKRLEEKWNEIATPKEEKEEV